MPGQEFVDPVDRMLGNLLEDATQVSFRIKAVELRRANQAIDRRGAFAAGIRTREQIVLAAERNSTQRPFGGVVVDLDPSVADIAYKRPPVIERIPDRLGDGRLARYAPAFGLQPGVERVEYRARFGLPDRLAHSRQFTANARFDGIQLTDPAQRFGGHRRGVHLMQIVEFAPHVRPARGFTDSPVGVKRVETGVGIGLQDACEGLEVALRVLALAVRRVGKPDRRWIVAARRSIVANIGP